MTFCINLAATRFQAADKNGDELSKDLPGDKGTADVEAAQREISALKVGTCFEVLAACLHTDVARQEYVWSWYSGRVKVRAFVWGNCGSRWLFQA